MTPPPGEWEAEDMEYETREERPARRFAGFRVTSIALVVTLLAMFAWNVWATRHIMALEKKQVVSVSLQGLITDFVLSESRRGATPEETQAKTKAYLAAVQTAVTNLGKNGTPVLVSEAVVGNSVPDATPVVKAAVAKAMGQGAPTLPAGVGPGALVPAAPTGGAGGQ